MQALSVLSQISALIRHADECHLRSFENLVKPLKAYLAYAIETRHIDFEGNPFSGCAEVSVRKNVTSMTSIVRNRYCSLALSKCYTGGPPPLNTIQFHLTPNYC